MKKRVLLSWSSGKDCAWALHVLKQDPEVELLGLFTTVNEAFDRVAMHAVRNELVQAQAQSAGLPLELIPIPYPCTNEDYEERMGDFVSRCLERGVEYMAFGDLYLEDVRQYREKQLEGSGIQPMFPIWGLDTKELSQEMLASGLRAMITCVDPKQVPVELAGKEYDADFLSQLPDGMDPCGENGEFHSFSFDGPMYEKPVPFHLGEVVEREGFVFADLLPGASS
nr:adenine nucleotide alpha hydrolase [Oceaniferula marina]